MATYAFFPVMWLATLAAPLASRDSRSALPLALAWCALAFTFGPGAIPPHSNAVWTTIQTVIAFVLLGAVLRQLRTPAVARPPALTEALPA